MYHTVNRNYVRYGPHPSSRGEITDFFMTRPLYYTYPPTVPKLLRPLLKPLKFG